MSIIKNKKVCILLLLLIVGLFSLVIFATSMKPVEVLRNNISLEDIPAAKTTGIASASYKYFKNYDEANKMSDTIIIGDVVKVNQPEELVTGETINTVTGEKEPLSHVFTVSEIKVTKAIKGKYSVGDIIKVKQYGGVYGNKSYELDGEKYLKEGERHLLFLQSYENSPCSIINPYQGDMPVIDGKIKATNKIQFINDKISEDKAAEVLKDRVERLEQDK